MFSSRTRIGSAETITVTAGLLARTARTQRWQPTVGGGDTWPCSAASGARRSPAGPQQPAPPLGDGLLGVYFPSAGGPLMAWR